MSFKKKVELFWVPFEAKKILHSRIFFPTFCMFFLSSFLTPQIYGKISLLFLLLFCWTSLFLPPNPSLSHSLFLLLLRFGGGGGGRFCPLWFEPSVVFSSLSSIRRLENE